MALVHFKDLNSLTFLFLYLDCHQNCLIFLIKKWFAEVHKYLEADSSTWHPLSCESVKGWMNKILRHSSQDDR